MTKGIQHTIWFIFLILVQVLLLNNIALWGANAYLYILFVIIFPRTVSEKVFLPICFLLGLSIDLFSNSYGIHAAATTFIGFLRPYLIRLCCSDQGRGNIEEISYKKQKGNFIKYMAGMVFTHHFLLFLIEVFSFRFFGMILLKTLISSLFTIILILGIQLLNSKKIENR